MDHIKDQSGRHLLYLDTICAVPDYVKSASVSAEETEQLGDHAFANPSTREFPLHTPAHVYLSHGYCKSAGVKQAAILNRIRAAATKFSISGDLDALDVAMSSQVKSAHVKSACAVEIDFGPGEESAANVLVKQGGVHGFYPINTPFEIEESAVKLANHKAQMPLSTFVAGCKAIYKAASVNNVAPQNLPRTVVAYGQDRMPSFEHLEFEAEQRMQLTGDTMYGEISKSASANADKEPVESYRSLWYELDAIHDLKYGRSVPDPFIAFNTGMDKAAYEAELDTLAVIADSPVPLTAIAKVSDETLVRQFPKEAAIALGAIVKASRVEGSGPSVIGLLGAIEEPLQKAFLKVVLR